MEAANTALDNITLALLLSPGGGVLAAAIIRQVIEVLKVALPWLDLKVSGALQAFVLSGVLYVVTFVSVGSFTPEGAFSAFLGWLGCATAAIGINSAFDHVNRVTSPARGAYVPRTDGNL